MASRLPKTSPRQYEIMVQYFEENEDFACGKLSSSYSQIDRSQHWQNLVDLLNSDGSGPVKDPKKWIKTWSDYKSSVRSKYARICSYRRRFGTTEGLRDFLSPLEERVLKISCRKKSVENAEGTESNMLDLEISQVSGLDEDAWDAEDSGSATEVITPNEVTDAKILDPIDCYVPNQDALPPLQIESEVEAHTEENSEEPVANPAESHQISHQMRRPELNTLHELKQLMSRNNSLLVRCSRSLKGIEKWHERLATAYERAAAAEERKAAALEDIAQTAKQLASE